MVRNVVIDNVVIHYIHPVVERVDLRFKWKSHHTKRQQNVKKIWILCCFVFQDGILRATGRCGSTRRWMKGQETWPLFIRGVTGRPKTDKHGMSVPTSFEYVDKVSGKIIPVLDKAWRWLRKATEVVETGHENLHWLKLKVCVCECVYSPATYIFTWLLNRLAQEKWRTGLEFSLKFTSKMSESEKRVVLLAKCRPLYLPKWNQVLFILYSPFTKCTFPLFPALLGS